MNLRIMTPEELAKAYGTDLREAFPPAELKPLSAMERMRERGVYDPWGLFDEGGEALGYALLWKQLNGSTRRGGASCWTTCASPGRGGAAASAGGCWR